MTQKLRLVLVAALPLVVGAWLIVGQASAEPIVGEETIEIPSGDSADQKPSDAMALFRAGDYDGSLKLWREVEKKDADCPPAQVIMAQLFFQVGKSKEAAAAAQRAAVEVPNDPEPHMVLAGIALRDGQVAEAEKQFQEVARLLPAFQKSARRKAAMEQRLQAGWVTVAEGRKDWPAMQKAADALLKLNPNNVMAMRRGAYAMFQQKNIDGALAMLRKAAEANKSAVAPEAALAQFYEKAGDVENVKKWSAAALEAAPKDLKTRLLVGQCALETGLMDDAQKHAVVAMQIAPESLEAEFFRGLVALCQKDYRTAESYFESAGRRAKGNVFPITNNLALALIEQRDPKKNARALEYAEANAKQSPKSANALSTYAWVLYRLGRLNDAEKAVRAAAAAGPVSVDTAYYWARIAADQGRKDEAKKTLETALKAPGRSMFRQEAEDLLNELNKQPEAATH